MRFADIPGLQDEKQMLINAVKRNHVAHAQLFYGKEGSANLALALAFISYINCEHPNGEDSCGECASCRKIDKLVHPDLHLVFPVAPTTKLKGKDVVSDNFATEWRSFTIEQPYGGANDWLGYYGFENKQGNISKEESRQIIKHLSLKAFEAKYKVMLIWLPEYMNSAAANAILKILEEPPSGTIFILVSHDYENLLTTIRSRVQLFTVRPFEDEEVIGFISNQGDISTEEATKIATLAEGSLSEAMKLLNREEADQSDIFGDWMRDCWQMKFKELIDKSNDFHRSSKVAQKSTLSYFLTMLRDALIAQYSPGLLRVSDEEKDFIHNFSKAMNSDKLEFMIKEINNGIYHLERNANAKILFLDISLKISTIIRRA
ncbi:MAG: DNA polymerase III subunit delta' [Bacteroidota bacterium]